MNSSWSRKSELFVPLLLLAVMSPGNAGGVSCCSKLKIESRCLTKQVLIQKASEPFVGPPWSKNNKLHATLGEDGRQVLGTNNTGINLETAVEREKDVQHIDVHR